MPFTSHHLSFGEQAVDMVIKAKTMKSVRKATIYGLHG
jgi:hypothetical protein